MTPIPKRILVAGFDQRTKDRICTWLHDYGFVTLMAHDLAEAKSLATGGYIDAAVVEQDASQALEQINLRLVVHDKYVSEAELVPQLISLLRISHEVKNGPDTRD